MIRYFEILNGLFKETQEYKNNNWIHVETPSAEDIQCLLSEYNVPQDYLNDLNDIDERPRLDIDEDWTLIIFRFPYQDITGEELFQTVPFGIIFSKDYFITFSNFRIQILPDFLNHINKKKIQFKNYYELIFRLILSSSVWYLKYLKVINNQINATEKELEKSIRNKEVHKLLKLEKSLVYFYTSLKGNENVFLKIKNSRLVKEKELDEELIEDVFIELNQAIETTKIHSDILSGMMDAFASVISNNLNNLMKKLTSISIVLMIPTLIASFYGMNVPNFGETSNFSFLLIALFSFTVSLSVILFFKRKRWI